MHLWYNNQVAAKSDRQLRETKNLKKKLEKLRKNLLTSRPEYDIIVRLLWKRQAVERMKYFKKKLEKISKNLLTKRTECGIIK